MYWGKFWGVLHLDASWEGERIKREMESKSIGIILVQFPSAVEKLQTPKGISLLLLQEGS